MSIFFKHLDCDAMSYVFMRQSLERVRTKTEIENYEATLKSIIKMFRYYRYDIGGRYEAREFALPDKLKYFPLFLCSFLTLSCFNPKTQINNNDMNFYPFLLLS